MVADSRRAEGRLRRMSERERPRGGAPGEQPVRALGEPVAGGGYDERQVAELLRRAASLEQKKRLTRPVLSLSEVEAIAQEAGIDPASVRQAARELEHAHEEQGLGARLAGAPLRRTIERVVDGELSTELHELLATDIREALTATGQPAQIATLGRSLSATTVSRGGIIDVQVSPKNGKTVVRITVNAGPIAGGLFGGLIGGLGGGLGSNAAWIVPTVLHAQLGAPGWVCAVAGAGALSSIVGGAYGLARSLFSRSAGSTFRRMEQLAETLDGHLRERLGPAPQGVR